MATKDELERENALLREENERLREQASNTSATPTRRPVPVQPSFGISEGTRMDLEMNGVATDPFTGKQLGDEALDDESEEDYDDYDDEK